MLFYTMEVKDLENEIVELAYFEKYRNIAMRYTQRLGQLDSKQTAASVM